MGLCDGGDDSSDTAELQKRPLAVAPLLFVCFCSCSNPRVADQARGDASNDEVVKASLSHLGFFTPENDCRVHTNHSAKVVSRKGISA